MSRIARVLVALCLTLALVACDPGGPELENDPTEGGAPGATPPPGEGGDTILDE